MRTRTTGAATRGHVQQAEEGAGGAEVRSGVAVGLSPPVAHPARPVVPSLQGNHQHVDGSFVELAQLLQFRNNEQERVKEAGAGDARPNSEKPPAFFFGAATSVSETVPLPFAAAFFAFFGAGENRLQKGLAPFFVFADGLS